MAKPRALNPVPENVRTVNLVVDRMNDRWWQVSTYVEPLGKPGRRETYRLVDAFTIRLDHPIRGLDGVYEALAQATLQQRLPGID